MGRMPTKARSLRLAALALAFTALGAGCPERPGVKKDVKRAREAKDKSATPEAKNDDAEKKPAPAKPAK